MQYHCNTYWVVFPVMHSLLSSVSWRDQSLHFVTFSFISLFHSLGLFLSFTSLIPIAFLLLHICTILLLQGSFCGWNLNYHHHCHHLHRHIIIIIIIITTTTTTTTMKSVKISKFLQITGIINRAIKPSHVHIRLKTYNTLALPTLLYRCETWAIREKDKSRTMSVKMKLWKEW